MEIILYPLISLYSWVFQQLYSISSSYGLAIILLSIFVSSIMLPLFWIGDRILDRSAKRRQKMQRELDSLKDVAGSLERYYYTRRIYRIYNYHPIQSLSNLLGLLIQIPFFLAAYFYLSHNKALEGVSFWGISNLNQADAILYGINLLPLLMTLFNILAAELYLLAHPRQNQRAARLQQYAIAILFLILLYPLPSGLLLYWMMNNLYSVIKNGIMCYVYSHKSKEVEISVWSILKSYQNRLYRILVSNSNLIAIAISIVFLIISRRMYSNIAISESGNFHYTLVFLLFDVMLFVYLLKYWSYFYYYLTITIAKLKFIELLLLMSLSFSIVGLFVAHLNNMIELLGYNLQILPNIISLKISIILQMYTLFSMNILSCIKKKSFRFDLAVVQINVQDKRQHLQNVSFINMLLLAYLAIFYSPLLAIASAPREFPNLVSLLFQLLLITAAVFVLLILLKQCVKKQFHATYNYFLFMLIIYLTINYYVFNTNKYGLMDQFILPSVRVLELTQSKVIIDVIFLYLLCFVFFRYRAHINKYIVKISAVIFLILLISSVNPLVKIVRYTVVDNKRDTGHKELESENNIPEKFFKFSRNGKNVLVVFFDRFIGGFIPEILKDVPELNEKLSGFTWFPNVVSPGAQTITGLPAIYGGYAFTLGSVNSPSVNAFMPNSNDWNKLDSESYQRVEKSTYFTINKFLNAGWHTFISDPSYLNGKWYGDPELVTSWGKNSYSASLLNKNYETPVYSKYTQLPTYIEMVEGSNTQLLKQLILPYSLFKVVAPSWRLKIYNQGKWNLVNGNQGWVRSYINNLALARMYPHLSEAINDQNSYYNFTTNNMTHDVYAARDNGTFVVQSKDGNNWREVQKDGISNEILQRFKNEYTAVHFFADKEALIQMAKWVDWLQQNEVYDNTMIIIVSDHGRGGIANPMFEQQVSDDGIEYSAYNALLMVKDFNQKGTLKTNNEFMSVADVPSIVLGSIEPDASTKYSIDKSAGLRLYAPKKGKKFLTVKDNIFNPENWVYQE